MMGGHSGMEQTMNEYTYRVNNEFRSKDRDMKNVRIVMDCCTTYKGSALGPIKKWHFSITPSGGGNGLFIEGYSHKTRTAYLLVLKEAIEEMLEGSHG